MRLLDDEAGGGGGRGRRVVECGQVERVVFGDGDVGDLVGGGGEMGIGDDVDEGDGRESGGEEDEEGEEEEEEGGVPLPIAKDTVSDDRRVRGMQKARNREMVRQAARRGVAFGFLTSPMEEKLDRVREGVGVGEDGRRRRRVEAVQGGRVVESSFAKGEWGVRWKDGGR